MPTPAPEPTKSPPARLFWWGLTAALGLQFLAHVISLSSGVTPSDGPEIAAAVVTLGVIHPTGYPLFTLVANAFTWLPLPVEPVIKIELMNAVLVAGASVFAALVVRSVALRCQGVLAPPPLAARRRWPRRQDSPRDEKAATSVAPRTTWEADLAGILAGVVLGTSPLLWEQLRIPEVYAMHVLLVGAALYCWTRFELTRHPKYVLWSALPMGLGLAHHVTMVYMLPAAVVYLLLRRPYLLVAWLVAPLTWGLRRLGARNLLVHTDFRHWWVVWVGSVIGALPLGFYAYFLWAHETTTGVSWGGVNNWDTLYKHMTGAQYHGYMKGLAYANFWKRIAAVPTWFDKQYMAGAVVLWVMGLGVAFRRAWPWALMLCGYGLTNIYHGAQYSVGDFRTYYLPAFSVCALILGLGVWWFARVVCYRPTGRTALVWGMVSALVSTVVAVAVVYYGHYARPRPPLLPSNSDYTVVAPLLVLAVAAVAVPLRRRRRLPKNEAPREYHGLSLAFLATVAVIYLAAGVHRAHTFASKPVGGEAFARGVIRAVPPGGVLVTIGDGKVFPLWYSQHVLNEGREIAVIDDRMIHRRWYRRDYLAKRHPLACDPLDPRYLDDLDAFFIECGDYRQRMEKFEQSATSWLKIDVGPSRSSRRTKRPEPLDLAIRQGGNRQCKDPAYRRKNRSKCSCWDFNTHKRSWDLQCVYSSEEKGIVSLEKREVYAHRIIEDHIDERPVFEGNVFTRRLGKAKNLRGWSYAAYRRISGRYHLINRGRVNQVFYWDDVDGVDPCAGDRLERLRQPPLGDRVREKKKGADRVPYQVNDRPQLIKYSMITPNEDGKGDDERFAYGPEDDVHLALTWFERNLYDHKRKNKKGASVRHGVRVCFFDPDGNKVHTTSLHTTGSVGRVHLPAEAKAQRGTYTVAACSVGKIGRIGKGQPTAKAKRVPDDRPCLYPILEYTFDVVDRPIDE
ncbi:MAG: DUF2723 domain-containing protein [Myxococcales bacterium FL481]|nr:MAG: DUF2723 domain-containing protein [Myxococcales bacterium FL481]